VPCMACTMSSVLPQALHTQKDNENMMARHGGA
jgi:hypothetical protein